MGRLRSGRAPAPGKGSLRSWLSAGGRGTAAWSGGRQGRQSTWHTWGPGGPWRCSVPAQGLAEPPPSTTGPYILSPWEGPHAPPDRLLGLELLDS